jgi:hypothetical protein
MPKMKILELLASSACCHPVDNSFYLFLKQILLTATPFNSRRATVEAVDRVAKRGIAQGQGESTPQQDLPFLGLLGMCETICRTSQVSFLLSLESSSSSRSHQRALPCELSAHRLRSRANSSSDLIFMKLHRDERKYANVFSWNVWTCLRGVLMMTYEDTFPVLRIGIYNFQASDPAEMASESPLCYKLRQMRDSKRVTMQQTPLV